MITVPLHCGVLGLTVIAGVGFGLITALTLAEDVAELVQVLVTVYVVFTVGEAVTILPVVVFNPVAGLHTQVPSAPEATNVTEPPVQTFAVAEGVIVTLHWAIRS